MANTLKFKRGLLAGLPAAAEGEPLFTTDTKDFYIGTSTGNQRFQKYIASGTTSQLLRGDGSLLTMPIVLTSPSTGQVLKYNGTNWVNDSDAGITGSGANGQVAFFTGATTQSGSNNLFWDNANGRLGIGTNVPSRALVVIGDAIFQSTGTGDGSTAIRVNNSAGTQVLAIGAAGGIVMNASSKISTTTSPTSIQAQLELFNGATGNATLQSTSSYALLLNPNGGNVVIGSTTNGTQRFQVTGDGYFSGSVGIGSTSPTAASLRLSKTIAGTGGTFGYGVLQEGVVQSNVTSFSMGFYNLLQTQAASFTLSNYYHYFAQQTTLGASSVVSNQYGFFVDSTLIGATNNFGFYGNIASGTGRWNLYMNGSAANYVNGELLVGSTTSTGEKLQVTGTAKITGLTSFGTTVTFNGSTIYNSGAVIRSDNGTAAAPSISFDSDLDTGIYRIAANTLGFSTLGTERMRLDASGNLAVGTTTTTNRLEVWGSGNTAARIVGQSAGNATLILSSGGVTAYSIKSGNGDSSLRIDQDGTERIMLASGGNLLIGTTTNAGFRLDVNGTMRVSGFTTISNTGGGVFSSQLSLVNSTSNPTLITFSNTANGYTFGFNSTTTQRFVFLNGGGTEIASISGTGIASFTNIVGVSTNDQSTNRFRLTNTTSTNVWELVGGLNASNNTDFSIYDKTNNVTALRIVPSTGAATFSSTAQAAGFITSGGAGYAVINSASNTVTALRPTGGGASIMSTNSNGLHIAVGTQAAGDLILASNNTERIRLSSNGFFSQLNATNPSASITDSYIQYSADVVAGNAAPHFRTENGAVIKLYQETTGVGNSIISLGGGNAVLDDTTFDGYTLRQIVKALRNQGILA